MLIEFLFLVPIHSNPDVDLESQATSLDHFIPPYKLSDSGNGANGFMLVVGDAENECLSHQMRVQANLFDALACNSDIDHPLCDECTDTLLELMEQQLRLTQNEFNDYSEYLRK